MADFFEKLKQGIDKGITTVSVKSKEMMDTQKIKGQIDTLQRQKKTALEELGTMVYAMLGSGSGLEEATIQEKYAAILTIDTEIKGKEQELEDIRIKAEEALNKQAEEAPPGNIQCECGNILPENAKFCGKCGKKLEAPPPPPVAPPPGAPTVPDGSITCECGNILPENAKFCGKCGKRIEALPPAAEPSAPAAAKEVTPPSPPDAAADIPTPPVAESPPSAEPVTFPSPSQPEEPVISPLPDKPAPPPPQVSTTLQCQCGAELLQNAKFCGVCGKKVEIDQPLEDTVPEIKTKFCGGCGSPLLENAKFCGKCGTKA